MTSTQFDRTSVPATLLIVVGILNCVAGALILLSGLARLLIGVEALPVDEAERIGFIFGTILGYGVGLVSLIAGPFIVFGAVQALRFRSLRTAKLAAVVAMLPVISCFFVLGVPVGIWLLVSISNPAVRKRFESADAAGSAPPGF